VIVLISWIISLNITNRVVSVMQILSILSDVETHNFLKYLLHKIHVSNYYEVLQIL
jgi:hypothetical protein